MSDVNANIKVNLDTSEALAEIKNLQRQISLFQQEMARSGSAANKAAARGMQSTLVNNLNATGQFRAQIKTIQSETEHFTEQLEKNKLSVGQYFRYAGASTKSFGKLWKSEFQTIEKVAIERVKTLQTQYIKLGRDANGALKSIAVRPLALDMNNLATKTAIAAQKQALLNQLLKQGSTAMLNWGKNTQWAGRQLMVGFSVPLAMAGTAAAKAYIDFEKAAIKFKRVYGDFNTASGDVDKMADSIKGLAQQFTKYGVAVSDTMNMAADAAAMGKTGADLLAQVTQSARLAVLGNVDQAQSLETLTSMTNTFGIAAADLATNIDFLNAVENQTVTSIEDLTIAIPKAAPVIKQLGGDVQDLTYFLTAMKEGGINASEGANAIKSGLASIINPTKQATQMLSGFGINITAIRDNNQNDVAGMVKQLAVELDKLKPMDRARAIEQLFGKFQFARMSTMFQNIVKDGSQANKVLETTRMSQEELAVLSERELKKIENSPAFKFEKALKDIQAKLIPVGEAFLKAITPIIEKVGGILDGFNNMGDGAKQFATMATIAIAGIGPVALMAFGLVANGVANLIKLFASLKAYFNGTRGETQSLGDATGYMTQKELEAQAVASSLEQSHARLTQQFTAQAGAINNLVAEYERAISAQARLAAGSGISAGAGVQPRKMATGGIVTGPGGPTDDAVPTNLSDGEAVIPAAAVKKNPGIIGALIQGKKIQIPGYATGHISGQYHSYGNAVMYLPKSQNIAMGAKSQNVGVSPSDLADTLTSGGAPAFAPIIAEALGHELGKLTPAQIQAEIAKRPELREFATDLSSSIASEVASQPAGTIMKDANFQEIAERNARKLAQSDKYAGGIGPSVEKVLDTQTAFENDQTRRLTGSGGNKGIGRRGVSKDISFYERNTAQYGAAFSALGGVGAPSGDLSHIVPRGSITVDQLEAVKNPTPDAAQAVSGFRRGMIQVAQRGGGQRVEIPSTSTSAEIKAAALSTQKGAVDGVENALDAAKKTAGIHSPAERFDKEVGKPIAQGIAQGISNNSGLVSDAVQKTVSDSSKAPKIPGVPSPIAQPAMQETGALSRIKSAANDIKSKGLDLIANGIDQGKQKVGQAAQGFVDKFQEGIANESKARAEASRQRMESANNMLMAIDSEYAANEAVFKAHQEKVQSGQKVNEQDIAVAQQAYAINREKQNAIATELENNGQDGANLTKRWSNAQLADTVNDLERENIGEDTINTMARAENARVSGTTGGVVAGNEKKDKKKGLRGSGRGVGIAMGASMAMGALSQLPGQAGQAASAVAGPLSAGLGVASMLPGPWGLALGAIVALGTAAFQVNEAMNKAREEAYKFARAMGTGKDAINKFAEFTGKATATEIMDKKREAKTGMFEIQPGKRTFGQSYFESEAGKGLRSSAAQSISTVGAEQSATLMANQLSTAVASGALDAKQARSIAAQLGQELGNVSFGINVVAQMNSLIGPDGENLTNGKALDVRINMIDAGQDTLKTQASMVGANVFKSMDNAFKQWDWVGNITGGSKGITIGSMLNPLSGANVAGIVPKVAAVATYFTSMGTEMGALQAGYQNQMEMEQQLVDSMDLEYQKKIEALKTQGKINEALELQQTYEQQRAKLVDQQGETVTANMDAYDAAGAIGQANLGNSVNDAIKSKFKDSVPEAALNKFVDDLTNADIDNRTEYGIKSAVSTGQMGMQQATMASQLFANNDANTALQGKDLEAMMGKGGMGVEATNQALGLASLLKNPEQQAAFMVKFKGLDNKEAQPILDALEEVKKTGKVFDAEAIVNFYTTNTGEAKKVKEDIDKLKEASKKTTKITIDMVAKETNPEVADAIRNDAEYFNGLDKDQQIIYTQTIDTMMRMKTDPKFKANYQSWLAAGNSGTEQDYINFLARQETVLGSDTTTPPANNNNGGGGGGPTAHWTDDYVKKLRNFAYANQKLTTGINASVKALKNFAKAGKASFSGLSEQLRAAGASEQMISHILEDEAKNVKKFFKNGKLTAEGLKVQARIYQATIAEAYDKQMSAAKVSQSQAVAMRKLSTAGVGYALASEMIADAQLAQAIAAAKNTAEINKLIAAYKTAQIEAYKAREATREGRAENDVNLANKKTAAIQAQIDQYQTGLDMLSSKEEEINKTYDKRIKALDKVLEINQDIAQAQKDQLDMAGALSSGDIFAAAKLMSQQKSEQVQKASEKQRQALEDAREYQIKNLQVEINGVLLTREEIDTRIKDLNDKILKIKHDEIDANNIILAQSALLEEQRLAAAAGNTSADNSSTTADTPPTTTVTNTGGTGGGGSGGSGGGGAKRVNPKWTTANNAYKAAKKDADDAAASVKNMESRIAGYEAQIKNRSGSPDILEAARKTLAGLKTNLPWTKRGAAEFARIAANKLAARNAIKQYLSTGGPAVNGMFARGVDVIPAMLKPGEFVMSTSAVQQYGTDTMQAINEGRASLGGSSVGIVNEVNSPVYNINVAVKSSEASPQEIAAAVMLQIKSNEKRNG